MALLKKNPNKIKLTHAERTYQTIIIIIVGLVTLTCLFPLLYVIGMSFTGQAEMIEKNYFVIIPERPTILAYQSILQKSNFWSSFLISVFRVLLGVPAALLLTVPGGYVLANKQMPGRRWFMIYFIITMILGGGTIPSYLLMRDLHLLNTFWVYIVPAFGGAFNMLIIKLFVEGIPTEIIESADLDGATEMQKMLHIAVPLLVPTLCALGLFAAVGHWNSWFDAMLYTRDANLKTIQFVIRELLLSSGSVTATNSAGGTTTIIVDQVTPEGVKMASVVVALIPILCVYPFLQKYFIYGMYTGSVKG
ncbi:ABC transporter permease [Hydrogeniiclostridium mannosilyticum]|uniref:ABC transporter permease n=1 Tax=Hydrogeniiclostridium mannosilyticum TaxID=2764322 RepID=A0A328UD70_9FIRM|nr:carbohydrate ABC transporter permease [Hydrogeniiclostridium mannosilyticum]RAQ22141.1 ABC transporter permease [Hydrogeniiclostridium mannosilyticum]